MDQPNMVPLPEEPPVVQVPNAGNVGGNPQRLVDVETLRHIVEAMNVGRPPSSKANITCPTFSRKEDEDFVLFEGQFAAYMRNQALNDEQAKLHLFSSFKDKAAMIVRIARPGTDVFEANPFPVYLTRIRALFVSRAQSDVARNNFENRIQEVSEEVQIYAALKMSLYQLAYGNTAEESHLIREFIRGLKDPKIMKKVVHNRPNTYEEAVASAMEAEAAEKYIDNLLRHKSNSTNMPPPKKITPSPPVNREEPMEINEISRRLAALENRGRNRDQYGRYLTNNDRGDGCWKCGDPNHFQRNCPKWQGYRGGSRGRGNRGRGRGGRGNGSRGRGNYQRTNRVASMDETNNENQTKDETEVGPEEHYEEDFQ